MAHRDGTVHEPDRVADVLAIQDLVTSYAYAVDDRDWPRWQALFLPDAHIDYTSAGGIAGSPAELAASMPEACPSLSSASTRPPPTRSCSRARTTARGHVHVFNRNGVHWEGANEIVDVGGRSTRTRTNGAATAGGSPAVSSTPRT